MRVAISSTNPVKIEAAKKVMEIIPVDVDVGISPTSFSEKETIEGAVIRAKQAIKASRANFGIGMEGGICKKFNRYFLCGWCAVIDEITAMRNTKRRMGSVGILTNRLVNKKDAWERALTFAMTKWLKPKFYEKIQLYYSLIS